MTIEQLQNDNQAQANEVTEMKADLKKIKEVFYNMAAIVGMVNVDGTVNEKVNIKTIMTEVTGIMMQSLNPLADKKALEQKFAFLKQILPIYEKYKHL